MLTTRIDNRFTKTLSRGLNSPTRWKRWGTVVAVCLAAALPVGAALGLLGGVYGTVALVALVVAYAMLRSMMVGLIALIGVICLLPFAAVPINIGFSPTFLDLVLGGLYFVWVSRIVTQKEREFIDTPPTGGALVFAGLATASFVLGLSHAPLTSNVLRHFAEILMGILLFTLVVNTVRTREQLETIVLAIMLAGCTAALIGIVIYALPDRIANTLLSKLAMVRYPSGNVLRYIEDNPELPERAISTSIDPNVFGGLLIFVAGITGAQAFAAKPLLPRKLVWGMLAVTVLCLILTFSRSSFVGLAVAVFGLGALRYRKMLRYGAVALVLLFFLPQAQEYVAHFIEGLRGEDLAMQMRLGEYKDAFILIGRYPWLGVGFSGTPDIDTYLGVSSVYLLVAEEMGIIGLTAFVVTLGIYLVRFVQVALMRIADERLDPIILGTGLAVAGAAVAGLADHYLFNLEFPHASSLLWMTIGLGSAAIRLAMEAQKEQPAD